MKFHAPGTGTSFFKVKKLHEVFTQLDETQWNILLCMSWPFTSNLTRTSFTFLAELLCLLFLCLSTLAQLPAVSLFCSSLSLEVPQAKNSRVCPLYFILFLNIWLCFPAVLAHCSYTAEQLMNTSAIPQPFGTMLLNPRLWPSFKQLKDHSLMRFAEWVSKIFFLAQLIE